MDADRYGKPAGFVATYRRINEPLLFNELHRRIGGLELLERSGDSAAFSVREYAAVSEELQRDDFVFLQHIHPFMCRGAIKGDRSDFFVFSGMLEELMPWIGKEDVLCCQCRIAADNQLEYSNGELTEQSFSYLEGKKYAVSVQEADTVISLTVFDHAAYMGISRREDSTGRRPGGVLFFSRAEDTVCRAELKIEEAFQVFGISTRREMRALDLGAAPGGWTHFLSKKGVSVDAVDPADLEEAVLERENVRHYSMTAQEFARKCTGEKYDIIVNDMKMDTNQSIDILLAVCGHLKADGFCLMTLKLPKQGIQKRINVARKVLEGRFETVRIRQLYYNRSEVTVYASGLLS